MRVFLGLALIVGSGTVAAEEKETLDFLKTRVEVPTCQGRYSGDVSAGVVTLLPDDIVCLSVSVVDGKVTLALPPASAAPADLLVLKFWYDPKSGNSNLTVHNPLPQFLAYEAHMLRVGSSNREYTSTCQVLSRRDGIEFWNYELAEITVSAFTVLPEAERIECR